MKTSMYQCTVAVARNCKHFNDWNDSRCTQNLSHTRLFGALCDSCVSRLWLIADDTVVGNTNEHFLPRTSHKFAQNLARQTSVSGYNERGSCWLANRKQQTSNTDNSMQSLSACLPFCYCNNTDERHTPHRTLAHEHAQRTPHILFGRICQLIFAPSVVALLNARVGPERLHGVDVLLLERCHRLVVHLFDHLRVLLQRHTRAISLWRHIAAPNGKGTHLYRPLGTVGCRVQPPLARHNSKPRGRAGRRVGLINTF